MWQIAQRDYKFGKGKYRSLTVALYDAIANHFRSLWGQEAGWAHSVLFTADLRAFSERLSTEVEVSQIKQEDDMVTPSRVVVEQEIKIEAQVKAEPEDGHKSLVREETARSRRAKRRKFLELEIQHGHPDSSMS